MQAAGEDTRIAVICNPTGGGGRAARELTHLERALSAAKLDFRVLQTECVGDATRLALLARDTGARAIVVVGGDGTLNEVSQAYIGEHGQPVAAPPVALFCAGTGDDFGRVASGLGSDAMPRFVERLIHLRTTSVDLGLLSMRDGRGGEVQRAFVNIASVGISGRVDELISRRSRYVGAKAAYTLASLRALLTYRNVPLEVRLDGRSLYQGPTYIAAIANGRYFGGGYQIAPNASIADGALDVVCIGNVSRSFAVALGPTLRRGEHLQLGQVYSGRAQQVELITAQPVLVDVDGETPGYSTVIARVVPNAMPWVVD
jgi:diacylglycerol kinase (ATP)